MARGNRTMPRLGFGEFYGDVAAEVEAGDVSVREMAGRPPEGVPRHTHESAHFCLIIRGEYETTTRSFRGRCGGSALLFHPAGTTHDDHFRTPSGSCLMISLPERVLEAVGPLRLESRSITLDDAEIGFPGARMVREMHRPDRFSNLALEGLAHEMIGRVTVRQERVVDSPSWLDRARAYVHDHAADPARVSDVAAAAGVHPVHLARVFRARLGLSPGEYLRRVRVRRAMEMLASGDDALATVAIRAGFCDQSELTKAFRRETGATPSEYRTIVRG